MKVEIQKVKEEMLLKECEIHKGVGSKAAMKAKLYMMCVKAEQMLESLPETTKSGENEKDWAWFVMRQRTRVLPGKLPSYIGSK